MRGLERVSVKSIAAGLVALVVLGGFVVALFANAPGGAPAGGLVYYGTGAGGAINGLGSSLGFVGGPVEVITASSTTTAQAQGPQQTIVIGSNPSAVTPKSDATTFSQPGNGSLIEFFSNVTMESPDPSSLASRVVELAYSFGGYVAYQSAYTASAYVVIRVPAADYQQALTQIRGMGNVTGLTSTSNDVTVKYTDLNATLASLVAERGDLLKLIGQSTSVNSTLAIMAQLQSVNAQINSVQSEMLQTQRLITYSTITVSVSKSAEVKPLSLKLSATPTNGVSPLGVTLNAVVSGGHQPYVVNYNFGDGTSQQGQVVIHQFYGAQDYNVTVTATDSQGNVTTGWTIIHVTEPPARIGFGNFGTELATLLIRVVEGMAVVAVVVIPIALVAAAVIYPILRRTKGAKEIRQG